MHPLVIVAMGNNKLVEIPTLVDVADLSHIEPQASGDRPIVSVQFNTNGKFQEAVGDTGAALSYTDEGWWLNTDAAPFDASDWEVRMTIDAEDVGDPGTFTGAAAAIWHPLSTTRTFTWTKDGTDLGTAGADVTFDLRQISDNSNSANVTGIDLDATISA